MSSLLMQLKISLWPRLISNQRPDFSTEHGIMNVAWFVHIEHHDRDFVVHAKAERGGIHDLETFRERFGESDPLVAFRVCVGIWIAIVNTVHFCRFQDD